MMCVQPGGGHDDHVILHSTRFVSNLFVHHGRRQHRSFDTTLGFPGEGPGRAHLRILSINITGWGTFRTAVGGGGMADYDVALIQETHVQEAKIDEQRSWARRQGWFSAWSAAVPTGDHSSACTGGVTIAWRQHIGLVRPPVEHHPARMREVYLHPKPWGHISFVA